MSIKRFVVFERSPLTLITGSGVIHNTCAFNHISEPFRNDLFPGYKTGEGTDPAGLGRFALAERSVVVLGSVWPMVGFETDDAIATTVSRFQDEPAIEQIVICHPPRTPLTELLSASGTLPKFTQSGCVTVVSFACHSVERYGLFPRDAIPYA